MGYSRPKERKIVEVGETELFVSGKSAQTSDMLVNGKSEMFVSGNRPGSNGEVKGKLKNAMLGTWGPKQQRSKQFEF